MRDLASRLRDIVRRETTLGRTSARPEAIEGASRELTYVPDLDAAGSMVSAAARLGYTVFGWTFGVFDTARPGVQEIRRRVRTRLRPGAIVLLHDGDGYDPDGDRLQTAQALPGIIADARSAGYEFAPLRELLNNHS